MWEFSPRYPEANRSRRNKRGTGIDRNQVPALLACNRVRPMADTSGGVALRRALLHEREGRPRAVATLVRNAESYRVATGIEAP